MEKKPILKRKSLNQTAYNDLTEFEDVKDNEVKDIDKEVREVRRVSFASSNFVKPFCTDAEKNTIWDNTYEEVLQNSDTTKQINNAINQKENLAETMDFTCVLTSNTILKRSSILTCKTENVCNNKTSNCNSENKTVIFDDCTMEMELTLKNQTKVIMADSVIDVEDCLEYVSMEITQENVANAYDPVETIRSNKDSNKENIKIDNLYTKKQLSKANDCEKEGLKIVSENINVSKIVHDSTMEFTNIISGSIAEKLSGKNYCEQKTDVDNSAMELTDILPASDLEEVLKNISENISDNSSMELTNVLTSPMKEKLSKTNDFKEDTSKIVSDGYVDKSAMELTNFKPYSIKENLSEKNHMEEDNLKTVSENINDVSKIVHDSTMEFTNIVSGSIAEKLSGRNYCEQKTDVDNSAMELTDILLTNDPEEVLNNNSENISNNSSMELTNVLTNHMKEKLSQTNDFKEDTSKIVSDGYVDKSAMELTNLKPDSTKENLSERNYIEENNLKTVSENINDVSKFLPGDHMDNSEMELTNVLTSSMKKKLRKTSDFKEGTSKIVSDGYVDKSAMELTNLKPDSTKENLSERNYIEENNLKTVSENINDVSKFLPGDHIDNSEMELTNVLISPMKKKLRKTSDFKEGTSKIVSDGYVDKSAMEITNLITSPLKEKLSKTNEEDNLKAISEKINEFYKIVPDCHLDNTGMEKTPGTIKEKLNKRNALEEDLKTIPENKKNVFKVVPDIYVDNPTMELVDLIEKSGDENIEGIEDLSMEWESMKATTINNTLELLNSPYLNKANTNSLLEDVKKNLSDLENSQDKSYNTRSMKKLEEQNASNICENFLSNGFKCDNTPGASFAVFMTSDTPKAEDPSKTIYAMSTKLKQSFKLKESDMCENQNNNLDKLYIKILEPPNKIIDMDLEISKDLIQRVKEVNEKLRKTLKNCEISTEWLLDFEELDQLDNYEGSTSSTINETSSVGNESYVEYLTLEEKIQEKAKHSKYWFYVDYKDGYYRMYTLYKAVPFKVSVDSNGTVCNIETYKNVIKETLPCLLYEIKYLREKLKKENLQLAFGNSFDIFTLLDYIEMFVPELREFRIDYLRLEKEYGHSHKLRITSETSLIIEIKSIEFLIWWIITAELSTHNLGKITSVKAVHHETTEEEVNNEEIQNIANNNPGPNFIENFVLGLNKYLSTVGPKRALQRKENLLVNRNKLY